MAVTQETIRKITVQAQAQGVDAAAASLKNMATAQATVAKESEALSASQIRSAAAAERLRVAQDALAKAGSNSAVAQEKVLLAQQRAIKADEALAASAERLRKAQFDLNAVKNYGASVTDISTRKVLSAEDAHKRQAAAINSAAVATQGFSKAVSVATNALGAMGLALGVGAMVAYGKSVFNTTADLQEQADQILGAGGNVEALQALRGTFLTNGIAQEQGDKILQRLNRTLGEASEGSQKAQDAFKKLGLGSKDLAGQTADAALPLVAKRLLEIEDASKRAAIETALFGKTGQQLESALAALAAGSMKELIARAKELGIVIDENLIKKADDAKDKMALSFMKLQVAIAPVVVEWGEQFSKLVTNIDSVTAALSKLWDTVKLFASIGVGARVGAAVGGLPGAAVGAAVGAVGYAASRGDQYQKAVANYDAQLASGTLSPSERADIQARRARALEQANAQVGFSGLVTLDKVNGYSAPQAAANSNATPWAPTKEDVANAKKSEDSRHKVMLDDAELLKTGQDLAKIGVEELKRSSQQEQHVQNVKLNTQLYIQSLEQGVDLAGMSTDEREKQAAIMEGMRVSEKQLTDAQKQHIASTVAARQEAERWRGVVDDISYGFQGFFENVLENGKLSFSSLWDSIKKSFIQMLAYMATQALVNPIIVPMVGGIAGSLGGSLGGGGSGFGSLLNLGSSFGGDLFGLGGPTGLLNSIGGSLGFSTQTAIGLNEVGGLSYATNPGAIFGSTSFGSFLGGAGLGSLAGSLIFGNKNDAGLGSMGGAAAGAAIGSIIPGVGTIIGGLLGGVLGGGLGSLTGSSNQGAISNFTNDGLGNTLFKQGGGNNGALATQATGSINQTIKALRDAGLSVSLGNISGLSVGSDKSYVYDFAGGKQKLAGGEAGVQATVNAILDRILPGASGTGAAGDLLQKYGSLNSGNVAAFVNELQAQKAQEAADAAQDLADKFNSLGTDLTGFANGLQESAKAAHDAASNWEKARDNLDKARMALLISAPGLSPTDQYNNSRSQFDRLLNAANGGSSQAASDLASYAGQFLQTSFGYNGSTSAYAGDLSYVQGTLSSLSSFSEAQRSYAQRQADALDAAVAQLSAIYDAIRTAANQNSEGLAALRSDFDELSQSIKDGNLQARMAS